MTAIMASSISNSDAANRSVTESKIPFWHLEIGAEESTVADDLARKQFNVGPVTL